MSKKYNLYLGKAGQYYIMSEFLARGWNTCTPDVDVGDDVLVLEDQSGQFKRVQVKTATAVDRENSYSVQFNVPLEQLTQPIAPELHYVFMVRHRNKWANTLIIKRKLLLELYESSNVGSVYKGKLILYMSFYDKKVSCKKVDFTPFIDDFSAFPDIPH